MVLVDSESRRHRHEPSFDPLVRLGADTLTTVRVPPGPKRIALEIRLQPGPNFLSLHALDPPTIAGDGRALAFGITKVRAARS